MVTCPAGSESVDDGTATTVSTPVRLVRVAALQRLAGAGEISNSVLSARLAILTADGNARAS